MAASRYDAIVIGGGHNGLVCGCYLAKAGLSVAVVERAAMAGGCILSCTRDDLPGYRLDLGGLDHGRLVGSRVVAELELERHGLRLLTRDDFVGAVFPGGQALIIEHDLDATCASIERFSAADADAYRRFVAMGNGLLDLLGVLSNGPPPSVSTLLRLGKLLPRDGRLDEVLQLMLRSARDELSDWFESEELKALIANAGTYCQLAPWQAGTGYLPALVTAAHRGRRARVAGGSGAFIDALVSCLRSLGGELITGRGVAHVMADRRRATGVVLDGGEKIKAVHAIVSTIDARRLLLDLLPAEAMPAAIRDEARRIKVAATNIGEISIGVALAGLPDFGPELIGRALTASLYHGPTVRDIDETFLDSMRGELPARPALMWALPSTTDPTLAPPGGHTMWIAGFVPWILRDGRSWDDAKEEMADRALMSLAAYAPDLPQLVRGRIVMSPLDWARHTGNIAGSADHVDQTLDQMWGNRPTPRLSGYRTPLAGLYLSGSGTHPGGGISGVPGRNTARLILRDLAHDGFTTDFAEIRCRAQLMRRGWSALDERSGGQQPLVSGALNHPVARSTLP